MKFFTSSGKALAFSGIDLPDDFTGIEAVYPVLLNEYYLSLIDWKNFRHDPIALQSFPRQEELADETSSFDPLAGGGTNAGTAADPPFQRPGGDPCQQPLCHALPLLFPQTRMGKRCFSAAARRR